MQKIGNYWVPDEDAAEGDNLQRTKAAYDGGEGIQIHHLHMALTRVNGDGAAIDGGANVGSWTKVLARRFAQVHSFEPYRPAFACLERNVDEWGLRETASLHEAALSDNTDGVRIAPVAEGKRSVTCSVQGEGDTPAMTIDSLQLPSCSFIKLDIEGYEERALRGARKTIETYWPSILIENRRPKKRWWRSKTPAERYLTKLGYSVVAKYGDNELDWLFQRT